MTPPQSLVVCFSLLITCFTACTRTQDGGISFSPAAITRVEIVKQTFSVEPRAYKWWEFNAGAGATISGRFEAQGGSGDDIQCVLMDQDNFLNWKNGHRAKVFYDSGKATVGTINVRVPEGRYFLVFDNRFSLMSNKAVSAEIYRE